MNKDEIIRLLPEYDIMLAIFHAAIDREMMTRAKTEVD